MNAPANIRQAATMKAADLPPMLSRFGGGFLTAIMIDAVGNKFALITAGKDGDFAGEWHPEYKDIPGLSDLDGVGNTIILAAEGSALAQEVLAYRGGDYDDWGIPALYQSDAQYRVFKPTGDENYAWLSSVNPYLFPVGYRHTETTPGQTTLPEFQQGGEHAFEPVWYYTSTQSSAYNAFVQDFEYGSQNVDDKYGTRRVRAVRMIQLID